MNDFASSAMLRVLYAGMRRQGLASPEQAWLKSAQVPLVAKRQLVGQVLMQRGWVGVLQLGKGVLDVQDEALIPYLLGSGSPMRLFKAWLRLERYTHSRHRIELHHLEMSDQQSIEGVEMRHYSLLADQQPSAVEDVVVLGVLLGLIERAGVREVAFRWQADAAWIPLDSFSTQLELVNQALIHAVKVGATARWQVRWAKVSSNVLGQKAQLTPNKMDVSKFQFALGPWGAQVAHCLAQQLQLIEFEALQIEVAANAMGVSTRSLQRHLQSEGLRFIDILGHVRVNLAAIQLSANESLSQIGFACGYTDQAHFCREFKRRVGLSPLQFRNELS